MKKIQVKQAAKVVCSRFDMCVSTMFSPFAGVLYTVSALENQPEKKQQHSRQFFAEAPWEVSRAMQRNMQQPSELQDRDTECDLFLYYPYIVLSRRTDLLLLSIDWTWSEEPGSKQTDSPIDFFVLYQNDQTVPPSLLMMTLYSSVRKDCWTQYWRLSRYTELSWTY